MTDWRTLALDLTPGDGAAAVAAAGAELASRLRAETIGLAALRLPTPIGGDGYAAGELVAIEREAAEADLARAGALFRERMGAQATWRSAVGFGRAAEWILAEARGADVLLASPGRRRDSGSSATGAAAADLALGFGRPVLIVPADGRPLGFEVGMLAWKDARECRRAALEALPLLAAMQEVVVLAIGPSGERERLTEEIEPVVGWLAAHGVTARGLVESAAGEDSWRLQGLAGDLSADVLVAGAYGRARLRKWALGGVTCEYLLDPDRCVLLSH